MAKAMQFDVGMDNGEFMRGSKDIARAISSLKSTVAAAGKSMNSSASGYGQAMRQSIRASREFEQSVESIKSRMDELRTSTASIKASADSFNTFKKSIENAEAEMGKLLEQQKQLIDMGAGGPSDAWNQNQAEIAKVTAELEKQQQAYYDYAAAVEYAEKRLSTGKDEWGHQLSDEEKKTYDEEANYNVELANQAVERIEAAEAALESLKQTQAELAANGENGPTQEFIDLTEEISNAESRLVDMKSILENMRSAGYENADRSDVYQDQISELQDLENELDNARAKKEEALKPPYMQSWEQMITVSGMISEGFGRIQNAAAGALYAIQHPVQAVDRALGTLIVKATQAAATFARMAGNAALSFLRKLASEAQNAAIQLAKLASNAIHGAFQKLAQGAAAAGKGLLGLVKHNKAADGSFKRGFMTIMKYAFGVRSMYFLFRRLRTAVKEAFTEMAKSSPEVNAAIRGLQTALNGLKGSLASAFAPIFTAVAPALIYLINMLTSAMNALGAFFAALTGQNSYKKAVGMAKSAGGAASKSAKKAKKDVKDLKRELLGFDELNIIHDDKDNDSSGGGGGGGAGSGMSFVDQQIPGGIKDFVDKLKELWNNKEYVKIGKLIADWINKAIAEAKNLITWENVSAKIQEFVDAIAGIIEGLLIYVDWKNIGDTIAEAFRTVTNTIDTFMQKVGVFMLAGSALAAMVNGFFGNKKLWTDIGKTITDSVHSFLAFGQAFLDGFDADEAGRGIRSAILTVGDKLPEIASEFWELVKTAFNKAGSFVNALLGGEEQPDLSKYVRPKPITANPKVTVNNSIWDDLAENLSTGFNTVIGNLTKAIEAQPVGETVAALAGWITKLKNGINWQAVGNIIGASFQKALEGIGTAIAAFAGNAQKTGEDLGKAINAAIRKVKWFGEGDDTVQGIITNSFKGAIGLVKGLFEKFDTAEFVKSLKGALAGVPWGDIAKDIWDFITEELAKLGNILTTLLGGEVTVPKPEVKKPGKTGSRNQNVAVPDTGTGTRTQNGVTPASLAEAIGAAVSAALTKLDEWIGKIPWDEWGTKVNEFLTNLPWEEWGSKLAHALFDLLSNIDDFISAATFGENYKDNDVWRFFHSGKAAEHDVQQMASSSSNLDEVLSKHGLTQESFASLKQLADSPIIGDPDMLTAVQEAQQKVAEIMAELDLDGTQTALEENTEALANNTTNGGSAEVSGNVGIDVSMNGESGTAEEAANSIADGFTDTLEGRKDEMVSAVEDPIVEANKNVHDDIEMGSPSALYESYGNSIVDGLILGLQDLPSKLQTIWDALPEWAQTMFASLGKTLGIDINANASGGNSGGDSGVSNKDTRKNTKASKKGTKETQKNTKELKKNTAKRGEVDVNYEGAGFDTSGDKPKLNVGVNFVPGDGSEASEENTNGGLLGWLQELLNADTIEAKVELIRQGWENFKTFLSQYGVDENTPIKTLIDLVRNNFTDFMGFLGIDPTSPIAALIKLLLDNAENILDFLGIDPNTPINAVIALLLQKFDSLLDFLGIDENNPIRVLLNLIKNIFDPDAEGVLGMDSKTIEALVKLVKDGFTTFLKFLGIDTDSPLIQTAIQLIRKGFTSFLNFLGIDTTSPVIQTILNLLFGKDSDDGAKEALNAENKDVDVNVDLEKGNEDAQAKETLALGGKSTIATVIADIARKAGLDVDSVLGLFGWNKNVTADKPTFANGVGKTSVVNLFDSLRSIIAGNPTLASGVGKTSAVGLFDSIRSILANKPTFANGVSKTSAVDLFNSARSILANKPTFADGVDKDSVVKKFTWSRNVTASGAELGSTGSGKNTKSVSKDAPLNLFTWKKKVIGTGAELGQKTTKDAPLKKFTWKKKVVASGATKGDGVKTSAMIDLFTSGKSIVANKPTFASGVNKSSAVNLFDKAITITATLSSTIHGLSSFVKTIVDKVKEGIKGIGNAEGGVISNGGHLRRFARGGVISGGMARYLANVPHYAGGTTRAHGTIFVAGEAGPEIMGHINGRTEILNKSQIAEAIYAAVMHGMGAAVNALGKYIANHMTNCTNSIVQTIAANAGPVAGVDYYAPAMATGGIMPYDVAMQIARSTQELQNTLDANNEDLIQAMVSAVGNAAQSIVQAMMTQAARGNQNRPMNTRMVVDDINRAGQMFGQSPIKGV